MSSRAPTSTPRVGSMSTSALRVAFQPPGQQHLLLVAAGQGAHRLLGVVSRPDAEAFPPATEGLRLGPVGDDAQVRDRLGQFAMATFSATGRTRKAPPAFRSAGRKPMPAPIAAGGWRNADSVALDLQAAIRERAQAEGGLADLRGARAQLAEQRHDLARMHLAGRRPGRHARGWPTPLQRDGWLGTDGIAGGAGRPTSAIRRPIIASIIARRSVSLTSVISGGRAVAEHLDPVGDLRSPHRGGA